MNKPDKPSISGCRRAVIALAFAILLQALFLYAHIRADHGVLTFKNSSNSRIILNAETL